MKLLGSSSEKSILFLYSINQSMYACKHVYVCLCLSSPLECKICWGRDVSICCFFTIICQNLMPEGTLGIC